MKIIVEIELLNDMINSILSLELIDGFLPYINEGFEIVIMGQSGNILRTIKNKGELDLFKKDVLE